ncbi:phytanoyl-CoA dioxygenase family protein [Pararhodonellum marinum]|uniref:phytanoyl-CoA dioxygenase family protein n=1 Tax=Pararhodonellum marinum TaxID=2755358 RepID=UPI00188F5430|nr:phytanoyl-CoA dioxygenase family protein [Pararhodonellum marinum]
MNITTPFKIDGTERIFSIENAPEFKYGNDEVLSREATDMTFHQPWYKEGFTEKTFLSKAEFKSLKKGLMASIGNIIARECLIDTAGFDLENYHHYVKTDAEHFKVVSKTRDLFSADFNFPVNEILPVLGKILRFNLTDIDPDTQDKMQIIVRINRPFSKDFNPPHKDIYEGVDINGYIPRFINFWIPIAGMTEKSNLPLAPKSHLINERDILRTIEGGKMEGNTYRVRMIQSWDGQHELKRSKVTYGQVLIFSSHLIHGLALNEESDKTRVSLEFRLYKAGD